MFVDARTLPAGENLEADICLVGAGPAGIALATALAGMGRRIVLAESGGLEPDRATQALNDGEAVGLNYRVNESRLRYFGGAGNHWAGNCRALDASNFESRSWLPHSGWPFARADLGPYYERARRLCGVAPQAAGVADFRAEGGVPVSWSEPLETAVWQISSMRHFGERFRSALADAPGITVLLNANLVQLVDRDDGQSIALARFGTLRGNGFTVAARRYVLACGGIENARLLLAMASERHPTGFGNQSGLVGRFFMEHPEIPVGALVYNEPVPYGLDHFIPTSTGQLAEGFRLANSIQRSAQIADVAFWPLFNVDLTASSELAAELGFPAQDTSLRPDGTSPYNPRMCTILTLSFEQSPNPDSRIKLSDRRDAFGMPQARLDWRLNDLDRRTFATALKIMAREAERQQLGRFWLRLALDGLDLDNPDSIRFDLPLTGPNKATNQLDTELHWGCHHMGTTRMHSDPRRGVVDPQARAHGIANLYIAGSSIFPNVGVSNPTLTIMALALKLADHLRTTTF